MCLQQMKRLVHASCFAFFSIFSFSSKRTKCWAVFTVNVQTNSLWHLVVHLLSRKFGFSVSPQAVRVAILILRCLNMLNAFIISSLTYVYGLMLRKTLHFRFYVIFMFLCVCAMCQNTTFSESGVKLLCCLYTTVPRLCFSVSTLSFWESLSEVMDVVQLK